MSRRVPEANPEIPRIPFGLESHFGPLRYEWLYCKAPKIIETVKSYHDDNVGTQSAHYKNNRLGPLVGQSAKVSFGTSLIVYRLSGFSFSNAHTNLRFYIVSNKRFSPLKPQLISSNH